MRLDVAGIMLLKATATIIHFYIVYGHHGIAAKEYALTPCPHGPISRNTLGRIL
jgi:hypothetical protein